MLKTGMYYPAELWVEGKDHGISSRSSMFELHSAFGGFPGGSNGKESSCNAGNSGLIPGLESCIGEWNGNPLQYFCLNNSIVRGAWQAAVHGVVNRLT